MSDKEKNYFVIEPTTPEEMVKIRLRELGGYLASLDGHIAELIRVLECTLVLDNNPNPHPVVMPHEGHPMDSENSTYADQLQAQAQNLSDLVRALWRVRMAKFHPSRR